MRRHQEPLAVKIRTVADLLGLSDNQLALFDPLAMNLIVAKEIPSLAHLDIEQYQRLADSWAIDIARRLVHAEAEFVRSPDDWKNDVRFFRLGFVCWYVDEVLGIRYREDQRNLKRVLYTDPSHLFLNGLIDDRRGTCGNMAALHVVLGWRFGWPVSLACSGSHFICRYDDGEVTYNIEATNNGRGGFHSHPDAYYLEEDNLAEIAVNCGSDLRAVSPREMLGLFVGLRARHLENTDRFAEAEQDYLLARYLFPQCRWLYNAQIQVSVQRSLSLFDADEKGHPNELAEWLQDVVSYSRTGLIRTPPQTKESCDAEDFDAVFTNWHIPETERCST